MILLRLTNRQKEQKTIAPTMNNPFGVPETAKAPTLKYKVLTPTYDPELMKRLDASDADIQVTRASESSKTIGNLLKENFSNIFSKYQFDRELYKQRY